MVYTSQLEFLSWAGNNIPGANHSRLYPLDIIEGVSEVIDICVQTSDTTAEQEVRGSVKSISGKQLMQLDHTPITRAEMGHQTLNVLLYNI